MKLLPEGKTLAEQNALIPSATEKPRIGPIGSGKPDEPSVDVRRSTAALEEAGIGAGSKEGASVQDGMTELIRGLAADLAIVDVETGSARRIVRDRAVRAYAVSPDGRFVVVDVASATVHALEYDAPSFSPEEGEVPPIWSADGSVLYGVGDGALWSVDWSVDPQTGAAREIARVDGWELRTLVTPSFNSPVAFALEGRLWLMARESEGDRSGIYSVDPATGAARPELQEDRSTGGIFSQAAHRATGRIFFAARNQQQPTELWAFDVDNGRTRQVSAINAGLERYALGEARLIHWTSARGEPLAGALLLPPSDRPGTRLPLVVWVYGGVYGSHSVGRFGLWGDEPVFNMHVLASRGYAVLYPDAPLRTGKLTEDLVASVLPGVDAAVDQGFADPDRLAIMGQSFGSLNTLALLTRTDRFKAAVITGVAIHPDLFADYLRDSNTGYWEKGQGDMGGSIWEQHDRYLENSPVFDFPKITTPLLIGQGDKHSDQVPTDAIFAAFERLGKSVELRIYRGEGHVINRDANVIDFWRRRLELLAHHLNLEVDASGAVSVPADGR